MNTKVAIVMAKRTAIGKFMGTLSSKSASDLGAVVISSVTESIDKKDISEVIMGQVLTGGCGQNPARQASLKAGIPIEVPASIVNRVCGSGLFSVVIGAQSIMTQPDSIIIAGGQESMSLAPHAIKLREPTKMGNGSLIDLMIKDGLEDAFGQCHMGITAENVAEKYKITREMQDKFACESQLRTEKAQKTNRFHNEITAVEITSKKETIIFDIDEFPRHGATVDALAKLPAAFKTNGTVTAGNSSGINDGAAAVLLMSEKEAQKRNLEILGLIESFASSGVDPSIMGIGPVSAITKALKNASWKISDIELAEANEAFAAQSVAVLKETGLDPAIVNVNGGAIALGHPIGASGTRCLVTLIHEMIKRNSKKGIVSLCIGGGMGIAMCISR
jgi:acetyl-CoA C-acetyltransferase